MRAKRSIIAFVLAAGAVGACRPGPPDAVVVAPFEFADPDAVLLITGGTHGLMETCDCMPMNGGLARRSGMAISYRAAFPGAVLLDTGDFFNPDPNAPANRHLPGAYRLVGYDAVVLAEQEWSVPLGRLAGLLPEGIACLSTTVRPASPGSGPAVVQALIRDGPRGRLAIVSDVPRSAWLFFPAQRFAELERANAEELAAAIRRLKDDGCIVALVCHGSQEEAEASARSTAADLIIRGHTCRASSEVGWVDGKPIIRAGGLEWVGALALRFKDGSLEDLDYRLEVPDERWPLDRRLIPLFRQYVRDVRASARAAGP